MSIYTQIAVLPPRVAGALRPSLTLTWLEEGPNGLPDQPVDLTGATLTGRIAPRYGAGANRDISGTLTVYDGLAAEFVWDFAEEDVVAGSYYVMFDAAYPSGPTPARSLVAEWDVLAAL